MCEKEHKVHSTVNFGELVPDINKLKEKLSEFKFSIDIFNDKVKFIIKKLNEIIKTLNIYYKIQNDMIDNYEDYISEEAENNGKHNPEDQ